jgi:hypothetical protein
MVTRSSVFEQAFVNLSRIPWPAWLFGLFASAVSALSDLVLWATGQKIGWGWTAPLLALMAVWLWAVYFSAVAITRREASLSGYVRFALTSLAALLPLGLTLLTLISGKEYISEGARVSVLLVGLVITFLFSSLLAGWPMAQSLSAAFVSPIRVLRATRGHRGSLIFLGFAAAGIGKSDLLPQISKADNIGEAVLIATGNALIDLFVIGLTAAIAVAAWQFAARADPTLDPS